MLKVPDFFEKSFSQHYHCEGPENARYDFYVVNMGLLPVAVDRIIACDPLFYTGQEQTFASTFPTGEFPVELSIARIADDERIGFARILFSTAAPGRWEMAGIEGDDVAALEPDRIVGYSADAGTGCFMDAKSAEAFLAFGGGINEIEENMTQITDGMEKTYQNTRSWLMWEKDGCGSAMFSAGWGDGYYASYIGYDGDDKICRLVTDFSLLDWPQTAE